MFCYVFKFNFIKIFFIIYFFFLFCWKCDIIVNVYLYFQFFFYILLMCTLFYFLTYSIFINRPSIKRVKTFFSFHNVCIILWQLGKIELFSFFSNCTFLALIQFYKIVENCSLHLINLIRLCTATFFARRLTKLSNIYCKL